MNVSIQLFKTFLTCSFLASPLCQPINPGDFNGSNLSSSSSSVSTKI